MFWIVLAILIIVGWIIYTKRKRKGSITLSNEQADQVLKLVRKEKREIAQKMHDVVDKSALEGKTIPLDGLCKEIGDTSDDVKREMTRIKQDLLEKYGPNIPVNTAHRISMELEYGEGIWSENPGCFERHLQRRDGNPLFPPERRIVTKKEIDEAKAKDLIEYNQFSEKAKSFSARLQGIENKMPPAQASSVLREIMDLLEEAGAIGGSVQNIVQTLERAEETLMKELNQAVPDGIETLEKLHSLSILARSPYVKQITRKDSPILKSEEIPTLLSEDLGTISIEGFKSRAYGPNYRPNEADIRNHLDIATKQGFSKERAAETISAWNKR